MELQNTEEEEEVEEQAYQRMDMELLGEYCMAFQNMVLQDTEEQQEEEPEIQCEVCTRGDRENLLLLCDGCDLGTTITY